MARPKLPAELSTEDLLSALPSAPEAAPIADDQYSADIIRFLDVFDIDSGKQRVPFRAIYDLYFKWATSPVSPELFSMTLVKLFRNDPWGRYFLNKKAFFLADKAIALGLIKKQTRSPLKHKWAMVHFRNYLNHYPLKAGKFWVDGYALYYLYDKYAYKIKRQRPLGYRMLLRFAREVFVHTINKDGKHLFRVHKSILNHITRKEMKELQLSQKIKKNEKKKKSNP